MIYNLTQHNVTEDQIKDHIHDVPHHEYVRELLTFEDLPTDELIHHRAVLLAEYAQSIHASKVMIGGALYLMPELIKELRLRNIIPYYSFSKRCSVDEVVDGAVIKKAVFRHETLIEAKL